MQSAAHFGTELAYYVTALGDRFVLTLAVQARDIPKDQVIGECDGGDALRGTRVCHQKSAPKQAWWRSQRESLLLLPGRVARSAALSPCIFS